MITNANDGQLFELFVIDYCSPFDLIWINNIRYSIRLNISSKDLVDCFNCFKSGIVFDLYSYLILLKINNIKFINT